MAMTIKLCALAVVTLAVMVQSAVGAKRITDPSVDSCGGLGGYDGPDLSNTTFDGQDYQVEGKEDDEIEDMDDEAYDRDFDLSAEDTEISESELKKQLSQISRRDPKSRSAIQRTNVADLSPFHHVSIYNSLTMWSCCPRTQRYGCRIRRTRLGCFSIGCGLSRRVCCPIWPNPIYTGFCNCNKCVQLTPTCANCGYCQRRYRTASFWAVCRTVNPTGNWFLQSMTRRVATSCYCKTSNRPNGPWLEEGASSSCPTING